MRSGAAPQLHPSRAQAIALITSQMRADHRDGCVSIVCRSSRPVASQSYADHRVRLHLRCAQVQRSGCIPVARRPLRPVASRMRPETINAAHKPLRPFSGPEGLSHGQSPLLLIEAGFVSGMRPANPDSGVCRPVLCQRRLGETILLPKEPLTRRSETSLRRRPSLARPGDLQPRVNAPSSVARSSVS